MDGFSAIRGQQWRLLGLLEKARCVVHMASSEECDQMFVELASFTKRALDNKRKIRDEVARVPLEHLLKLKRHKDGNEFTGPDMAPAVSVSNAPGDDHPDTHAPNSSPFFTDTTVTGLQRPCSPFGVCDVSPTNETLCECCDDGKSVFVPGSADVEACALCLCLLQRGGDLGLRWN